MSEKQKFTLRISTPATGEIKETWVDGSSKIEAAQKFLRRKYVAEWFVEGEHPMKMDVLSEVEIEQENRVKDESLGEDETGPNGETVERPGDHQQPTPSGPPDPPYPPGHRLVG